MTDTVAWRAGRLSNHFEMHTSDGTARVRPDKDSGWVFRVYWDRSISDTSTCRSVECVRPTLEQAQADALDYLFGDPPPLSHRPPRGGVEAWTAPTGGLEPASGPRWRRGRWSLSH